MAVSPDEIAQKHLKRNFSLNALDGISFFTGMIFLSPENVLPVFMNRLGASAFLISLIPVLKNLGVFFPSIFVARHLQSLKRKKAWILKLGLLQRVPWFFCGIFCLYYAEDFPLASQISIMLALFLTSLGGGFNIPAFSYLTAKTIPVALRGRLFAVRNLVSYIIGFLCGGIIAWILKTQPFPQNFSILMIVGFCIIMIYFPAIGLIVEPDAKKSLKKHGTTGDFFASLRNILKNDGDLRNYIRGRIFFTLAFASYNYFAVYLVQRFQLPESEVGIFTLIVAGTYVLANPLLGILSDRFGHLFNHYLGSIALIIANLIAIFSPYYWLSLASIALGAFVLCVLTVSCFSLPMEFGEDHEIPIYVGLVGLFIGGASIAIIGFGLIADRFGYHQLFWICLTCSVLSIFFYRRTREPRQRRARAIRDVR